ncbi:MAG: excinuclease ABC subunit UvrA [Myxococcota bacterium]|nr:excinuclease ABC subunit UvrA [Myxococcota bacterium]
MATDQIKVIGAREHNLKGVSVDLPRDSLVVITGLSGSGKSSLAFDTIYQEGQRRFMESLSAYARQFLGQMTRPQVERVDGLSPTLCIDQKTVNRNPRSTVGTVTEILDHLRLLLARLGTPRCPICLETIQSLAPGQIADHLTRLALGKRLIVMAPVVVDRKGEYRKELAEALASGFLRARIDGEMCSLEDDITLARYEKHTIELVTDRISVRPEVRPRLVEAIERSLALSDGVVTVLLDGVHRTFSSRRACPTHGVSIPEMEPRLFSFNAPQGMCTDCSGIGWLEDFDIDLLIDPDAKPHLALRLLQETERVPFSSLSRDVVKSVCRKLKISLRTPWRDLTDTQQRALLLGADVKYTVKRQSESGRTSVSTRTWKGFMGAVRHVWHFTHLKRLTAYRRRVSCPGCAGKRLNPIALAVDFRGQNIATLSAMNIDDADAFFASVDLSKSEALIGAPILREIRGRLAFLNQVGLSYLSLNRTARSLSGGESQRIRLAGQVGAGLQGVTYVLDEPSIGLHSRDQSRLLDALEALRDKGNTVLVVEHDTATMARADYLVEVGPGAGREGGYITAAGTPRRFLRSKALTARYLRGEERIPMPAVRREGSGKSLVVRGARENNLRGVDLTLPLGVLTVVTGVSGSGKSTLVTQVLARAMAMALNGATARPGAHDALEGVALLDKLVEIDQSPIGRTPRSNPVTYTKAWEPIRTLFAATPESRRRGYTKSRFSFNVDPERGGGRCEECSGAGVRIIEMQFLADVQVPCESCGGKRFDPETLEIRYKGKTISEILELTVEQGAAFFSNHKKIHRILSTLASVGLTYISLGQPSTTLSGGEAQRIKLASELHRPATGQTLYILDEPTTGLHMADVRRLLGAVNKLVEAGNTVVIIEHNTDVIKCADHIVDLGPEGGVGGGLIVAAGTPEHVASQDSPTGRMLTAVLAAERADPSTSAPAFPLSTRRRKKRPVDIQLRGVSTHNLQGIDVDIPRGAMTVITGPSGSGKTSLAFDTLFSEGQRRYVESLSTYARRFLGRLQRAPVESAEGLAPAIAIDQRNGGHNPRSTVATVTEIYDTYRLLYARIGHPHCPHCARPIAARPPAAAARFLKAHSGSGWLVADLSGERLASELTREGFARVLVAGKEVELTDPAETLTDPVLVIDRINPARSSLVRLSESISTAYAFGRNHARFIPRRGGEIIKLSRAPECPEHGPVLPEELTPRHFSFNSHLGACPDCSGLGRRETVDPALLFPDPAGSFFKAMDGRVAAALSRGPRIAAQVKAVFARFDADPEMPTTAYSRPLRRALLHGLKEPLFIRYRRRWGSTTTVIEEDRIWPGVVGIIEGWKGRASWLLNVATCPACDGDRLQPALLSVRIGDRPGAPPGLSISDACALTISDALSFWSRLSLTDEESTIAEQALKELTARLTFLQDVGLAYLTLDRSAGTLSGGESQRIRLATQLGSRLTGTIYVLDEPTTGLHQRDTARLLDTLEGLRELGNTLVVVEHDPEVMLRADRIIDMGPGAGEHGGRVIAQGAPDALGDSLTGRYLSGAATIPTPTTRRKPQGWMTSTPSTLHNLRSATARFPRGCFTAVTGVSGSGKSTLVMDSLRPQLEAAIAKGGRKALRIKGRGNRPRKLVVIDQKPIGRTPRSTPLTYCGLLTPLRTLFSQVPLARRRGYKPGRFSFNVAAGRCSHCEGRGAVLVEMHFLSDVWIPCELCGGRRYNAETMQIRYKGVSIADVLDMTAEEARGIFTNQKKINRTLTAMCDVGLGYLRLGQPATTLSGGEAQRLKLASELSIGARAPETCFLLDEPTTGLHFSDVEKLLVVLHRLVDAGHMVVVIEHHLDVIKNADHIIDMGPEGGAEGGQVIATGTPEQLILGAEKTGSWTARALRGAASA